MQKSLDKSSAIQAHESRNSYSLLMMNTVLSSVRSGSPVRFK
jgi:hypothetical protein